MHNVYNIDYSFDREILLNEYYKTAHQSVAYKDHRGSAEWWRITHHSFEYAEKIMQDLGVTGKPRFYLLEANRTLPWHKDNGTECAINVVLSDNPSAVKFRDGEYKYLAALLNTQNEHCVENGDEDRILFKISIFNETYEQVLEKIRSQY